ncbi:MAG: amidohydrolase family protein [Actinomycetes bacterium]
MPTDAVRELAELVDGLPLVDHHVHGATRDDLGRVELEGMLTESAWDPPDGTSQLDSQVGFALRRWCAPVLGLPPHAEPDAYLARRRELGAEEVNARLLRGSGIGHFLVETGYRAEQILDPVEMAKASGAPADEVVRLESVAEQMAAEGVTAAAFADGYADRLGVRTADAVGVKSVIAYRFGFDFDSERPTRREVVEAAGRWLDAAERTGSVRLDDPVLLRHLLWAGVDRGLPVQLHTGYGDPDLELHRCDPLLLTRFLREVRPLGVPVMLLHCYPFHRNAGYLAQTFPNVYLDVGLAVNYTGARSEAVVAESLELAPFAKLLFSSDAWGPAELHHLGAHLWRSATIRVLSRWVADGEWSLDDAKRVARLVGVENARRVYRLDAR